MRDVLYMAWRYVGRHPFTTAILVVSVALILFIPAGLRVLVARSETLLTARAEATPLLVGARGSPLELALRSLYFAGDEPPALTWSEVDAILDTGLAAAIPLSVRFETHDHPIVGTTLDYFELRGLAIADGRAMTRLGDCVLGAAVARQRGLGPGDRIESSPETVFDLAGVYPLRMRITGVLERSGGPDDEAVFTDLPTTWVMAGLAHGHDDLARPEAAGAVLSRDEGVITANESVVQFNEITDDNIDSFHFHGDRDAFPITSVIAVAPDQRSATLLLGRYQDDATRQIVRPPLVVGDLLDTIVTIEGIVLVGLVLVGAATVATMVLVLALSLRLRRREIETMVRIGGSRGRIASILGAEVLTIIAAGVTIAALLTWMTVTLGADMLRGVLFAA